ncbi:MAG: ThiF family adenylyltransferase [Anaerorhabdus sp.]
MSKALERVELLLKKEGLKKLQDSCVMIIGVGGVGSYAAEALARSGIGKLILVDHDVVAESNLNRQVHATIKTIGQKKTTSMKERIALINPDCQVEEIASFFSAELFSSFEYRVDYVIDAIDTVSSKIDCIELCHQLKIPCISSLGMANRLDPTKLEVTTLAKTTYDPLAKACRAVVKKRKIRYKIPVVFSREEPYKQNQEVNENGKTRKERIPPASLIFVPAAAGLTCASIVLKSLCNKKV